MNYGMMKVAAAIPAVKVAAPMFNEQSIETLISEAAEKNVEVICFPELSITGYSCQDLFHNQQLLDNAEVALMQLMLFTRQYDIIVVVGMPVRTNTLLLNCAVVLQKGNILGLVPKTYLPNYNEFYEQRWFASASVIGDEEVCLAGSPVTISSSPTLFVTPSGIKIGIELCEDVWSPLPPSTHLTLAGADIILNLSATDELIGKHNYLVHLLSGQSARTISAYVYASCGFGESTQDVVYGGNAMIFENGRCLASADRFALYPQLSVAQIDIERLRVERRANTTFAATQKNCSARLIKTQSTEPEKFVYERVVNPWPFIPEQNSMQTTCEEILSIQTMGLVKRLAHTHCNKVVLGISGGLDSTLALLVCVRAFDALEIDRKGIIGITMPGFGTTDRTYNNAIRLMQSLGVTMREISIAKSVLQHFEDIGQEANTHDVTYENSQARERTQVLMDVANKEGGLVIGTGDLSELALGWATYNGDHMSMYAVNTGVPKTLVKYLVRYMATSRVDAESSCTLLDIIDTPISPELIPADSEGNIKQKTEDLVGPYELHDFFLYYFLRLGYSKQKILLMAEHAFDGHHPQAGVYTKEVIEHWLEVFCRRFFAQQFKRSCLPDGPKVGSVSLSPRGDWRMPSDAVAF
ncbi:MAG: NAD(+) synthase [Prevotella sp.]|nr:NAD(+) synthase [Prevotella sp.]MCI5854543.1 NAD(+) synthase [Prevotella sp.]MDD6738173.1 NAD(+) synthase [Prevotella sp.]MDY6093338.1 NAD(+) synthase [Prevotella sp.]